MNEQWSIDAWVAVAALGAVGLLLLLAAGLLLAQHRARRRTASALAAAHAEATALRAQVELIEQRLDARDDRADGADGADGAEAGQPTDYVITRLGNQEAPTDPVAPGATIAGPLFADLVLRESVVQAASLAAGLRRALAPEVRHRIRFEMRREVKRARKQRRVDTRTARRDWEARQRAAVDLGKGSVA